MRTNYVIPAGTDVHQCMLAERENRNGRFSKGFRLDFGEEGVFEWKRDCHAFSSGCADLQYAAKKARYELKVFPNMNGQIAAKLVEK